jgi:SNF2 family DNA or RNA helicase
VPELAPLVSRLKERILQVSRALAEHNKAGWGIHSFGGSFESTLKHIVKGQRNATFRFLDELADVLCSLNITGPDVDELTLPREHHRFYDRITRIDESFEEVMDIEVDDSSHAFVADGFINHNTLQAIAAVCYLWPKEPANRVIVIAPKSALQQWASEIRRFTKGVRPIVATGTFDERRRAYDAFFSAPAEEGKTRTVMLVNYHVFVRDWKHGQVRPLLPNGRPDPKHPVTPGLLDRLTAEAGKDLVVIFDEATAFKNMATKTWDVCRYLSDRAKRVYGLTATLLKNRLEEGFSIFKCIRPDVFTTKTAFLDTYCVVKLQSVGLKKIPIVIGYKNLDLFRSRIDPFFLGRPKHAVSNELPTLTTREVLFPLSPAESAKYSEALSGVFELGDGEVKDYEEHKAFVSLIYCQQVVNSLHMLKFKEGDSFAAGMSLDEEHKVGDASSKEQVLVDLVTEELDGEKIIVFTRFESHVGRLVNLLKAGGVKSVRITGKEKDKERKASQDAFQDLKSDTRVVFITAAGSEAINLQAASAMVFFDAPWSWGEYVQIIGRMIRIGSPHKGVLVYHLIAERPGDSADDRATIDTHTLTTLRHKKVLIDRVIGEAAVGALEFEKGDGSSIKGLLMRLQGKVKV